MNSNVEIIVTSIKNVEEIILNLGDNITTELKQKAEDTIYKGYEELSKLISDNIYFDSIYEKGEAYGTCNKTDKK